MVIKSTDEAADVYKGLFLLRTNKELTPEMVLALKTTAFSPLYPQKSFSERLTVSKYYWIKIVLKSELSNVDLFYFQFNSQVLDLVRGYQKKDTGDLRFLGVSGTVVPFRERVYGSYDIAYPVLLQPGRTTTLLFRLFTEDGESIRFLPQFRPAKLFKADEERFYLITGLLTGLMLAVFLLNFFLGFSLKENIHFFYACYIIVALYELYSMVGADIQFIYPNHPEWSTVLQSISPSLLALLMTRIMQIFLEQRRDNSKYRLIADIGLWSIGMIMVLNILTDTVLSANRFLSGFAETLLAIALLGQCVVLVLSAIEKILQGYKLAWFYFVACIVFIAGLVEFIWMVLSGTGQELVVAHYPNDLELGIVIESLIVFAGLVYRYNRFKKDREWLMAELNRQQQILLNRIVSAEEAERKRIAQDLHDDIGATLSTLSLQLSALNEPGYMAKYGETFLQQTLFLANKASQDIRLIAHNLLPKDFSENGLFMILENKILQLNFTGPIVYTLVCEGDDRSLDDVLAVTIYRVINELLTNIGKHSVASEAALQVFIEGEGVQILLEDDGIGFDKEKGNLEGIGLKNIKSRIEFLNGRVHIDSTSDGTQTVIQIPSHQIL